VCNLALTSMSNAVAQKMGMKPQDVKKEWIAGMFPGLQVIPSGVVAINAAQARGCRPVGDLGVAVVDRREAAAPPKSASQQRDCPEWIDSCHWHKTAVDPLRTHDRPEKQPFVCGERSDQ
jgi:hypothetical protein